jgi:hypothetical protein
MTNSLTTPEAVLHNFWQQNLDWLLPASKVFTQRPEDDAIALPYACLDLSYARGVESSGDSYDTAELILEIYHHTWGQGLAIVSEFRRLTRGAATITGGDYILDCFSLSDGRDERLEDGTSLFTHTYSLRISE